MTNKMEKIQDFQRYLNNAKPLEPIHAADIIVRGRTVATLRDRNRDNLERRANSMAASLGGIVQVE